MASNRTVTASNQVWEIDIKYGYVQGEDKFFYTLNVIDVFDRANKTVCKDGYLDIKISNSDIKNLENLYNEYLKELN